MIMSCKDPISKGLWNLCFTNYPARLCYLPTCFLPTPSMYPTAFNIWWYIKSPVCTKCFPLINLLVKNKTKSFFRKGFAKKALIDLLVIGIFIEHIFQSTISRNPPNKYLWIRDTETWKVTEAPKERMQNKLRPSDIRAQTPSTVLPAGSSTNHSLCRCSGICTGVSEKLK